MSSLLTALARAGDAWDAAAVALKAAPGRVRAALGVRRRRRAALIAASLTLLVYLFSIGDLAVSASGRFTGAPVFQAAPGQLLEVRAPYLFEPVFAWHPTSHVAVLLSPVNLLLGAVVAALVGCNIAVAAHAAQQARLLSAHPLRPAAGGASGVPARIRLLRAHVSARPGREYRRRTPAGPDPAAPGLLPARLAHAGRHVDVGHLAD
jgi:hypothetical protein